MKEGCWRVSRCICFLPFLSFLFSRLSSSLSFSTQQRTTGAEQSKAPQSAARQIAYRLPTRNSNSTPRVATHRRRATTFREQRLLRAKVVDRRKDGRMDGNEDDNREE
ncbi:hypothetical protein IWZ01DRAFT_106859 [Phyllosticta capitalensis]